jgi:glycosyltransferase involved in cell wall biosynthesis
MVNILYFGNKTSAFKSSKSVLETLEPLFGDFANVSSASNKKNKLLRILSMILLFFMKFRSTDYILIDVYSTKAYIFTIIISFLSNIFKKKYILILHGGDLPKRFINNEKKMKKLFIKAYSIVAPSNYLKEFFVKKGVPVTYIPNIIELKNYPFKARTSFSPNFISIRGFDTPYNPLMILKSMSILKTDFPNFKLYFIGDETDTNFNEITKYIDKNSLSENIYILPRMSKKEWTKLSEKVDFMISTPIIDNTPVSVIEGMALGLVVISTKVGGIPYLIEEDINGVLIDSNDHLGLANSLKMLLFDDNRCKEIAINGRKKARSFDWNFIKKDWEKLLSKNK